MQHIDKSRDGTWSPVDPGFSLGSPVYLGNLHNLLDLQFVYPEEWFLSYKGFIKIK